MRKGDDKAFIFTLTNPHGVEPTRFMNRKRSRYDITCCPNKGPLFGMFELWIENKCNEENSCSIGNNDTTYYRQYDYHPEYKLSLFVNTAGPDKVNKFTVFDYEVYCIENYKDYIYHTCKYPDVIWEYIETKGISDESLKQFDDNIILLNDLDAIDFNDNNLRLKITQFLLKDSSDFLPNTQIVNKKYDSYLREWCGDYKWELIYRASEHGFTTSSFFECCKEKRPTLIVIKSSEGWIFGGYTTQYWSRWSIYYNIIGNQ